jgi:hypothetical protein
VKRQKALPVKYRGVKQSTVDLTTRIYSTLSQIALFESVRIARKLYHEDHEGKKLKALTFKLRALHGKKT